MTCVQFLLSNCVGREGTTGSGVFSWSAREGRATGHCLHGVSRVPTGPVAALDTGGWTRITRARGSSPSNLFLPFIHQPLRRFQHALNTRPWEGTFEGAHWEGTTFL